MIAGALWRDPSASPSGRASCARKPRRRVRVRGHEVSQGVAKALGGRGLIAHYLQGGIEEGWEGGGRALDAKPVGANTRWVTRERPKIDRIACPWLVARFVDPGAEFLYVPTKEVLAAAKERDATPYDVPDVHFSHEGERCSFDAFLKHYRLADPRSSSSRSSSGERTRRAWISAPQAPGLAAISLGLSRNSPTTTRC